MPLVAHVVTGGPEGLLWPTSIAMFGGLVAAVAWPQRRTAAAAVGAAGLVATVLIYATWPSAPLAPAGVDLGLASPAPGSSVTSPVPVTVCTAQGPAPGPGRLLSVSVDGAQVVESRQSTVSLTLAPGAHQLQVQLLTADHRAFAPPIVADASVLVTGTAPLRVPAGCDR